MATTLRVAVRHLLRIDNKVVAEDLNWQIRPQTSVYRLQQAPVGYKDIHTFYFRILAEFDESLSTRRNRVDELISTLRNRVDESNRNRRVKQTRRVGQKSANQTR